MKQKTRFTNFRNIGYQHRLSIHEWPIYWYRPQESQISKSLLIIPLSTNFHTDCFAKNMKRLVNQKSHHFNFTECFVNLSHNSSFISTSNEYNEILQQKHQALEDLKPTAA